MRVFIVVNDMDYTDLLPLLTVHSQGNYVLSGLLQPRLRTVPVNTEVFLKSYDYGEKADLSKGYWNLKTQIWVTMYVSKIIKQP